MDVLTTPSFAPLRAFVAKNALGVRHAIQRGFILRLYFTVRVLMRAFDVETAVAGRVREIFITTLIGFVHGDPFGCRERVQEQDREQNLFMLLPWWQCHRHMDWFELGKISAASRFLRSHLN